MQQLKVNAHQLNFRNQPNTNTSIILGVMDKGEVLDVIEFVDHYKWVKVRRQNGTIGFCSYKYCLGVPDPELVRSNDYKWLKIALGEMNINELLDPAENYRILTYLRSCEFLDDSFKNSDETAWCAAFMNWCVEQAGYAGTDSAWALDWKNWGQASAKRRGSIAVFERYVYDNGVKHTYGHVGFYLGMIDGRISLLGGNQSNSVSIDAYPILDDRYKFLGCRRAS